MSDTVKTEVRGRVLEVTLDRPKANAIDAPTSQEMGRVFCRFRDDPELRVAIVTGGGQKFFSAGWDLKAAAEGEAYDADNGPGGFAGLTELHDLNKPVIAAVNGMAVGGGFELALSSDIILAAEHAQFFLPEIHVGVLADAATYRLARRIPYQIAMELLFTGRRMGAEEAHKWGLANEVLAADKLMIRAREIANALADGPPLVFAAIKDIVRSTANMTIPQIYGWVKSDQCATYTAMLNSEDAQEGPRAFAEGRDPVWSGR